MHMLALHRTSYARAVMWNKKKFKVEIFVFGTLGELEGIELKFDKSALDFIAEKAMEFNLGARGLRSICEEILTDAMFDLPSNDKTKSFKVTKSYAQRQINKSKLSKLKVA